jgi:hypothetical protein
MLLHIPGILKRAITGNVSLGKDSRTMANVRQSRRQLLKRAGVLGALVALFSPSAASAQGITESPIGGSWSVAITPQEAGAPSPFQALHTFTGDGAVTTAEQRDMIPPTFMSPGHGGWVQLPSSDGPDDFAYNYRKLVVDAQGNLVGTMVVHIKIELIKGYQAFKGKGTATLQPATGQAAAPDYSFDAIGSRISS